jgi:selenocysteine lyase/cysteine desulfurase
MQPSASFEYLREQIVGVDSTFTTPFGERLMVYCDYTASGRCLLFVENYLQSLQRTYANTHTADDTTGRNMTQLLREAENSIKASVNAGPDGRIIAIGTGATGAINKLQQILGVYCPPATRARIADELDACIGVDGRREFEAHLRAQQPVVFVGPFEHHSNEVSWREGFATVVEVRLDADGAIDIAHLEALLATGYQSRIASVRSRRPRTSRHPHTCTRSRAAARATRSRVSTRRERAYVQIDMNPRSSAAMPRSTRCSCHRTSISDGPDRRHLVFNKRLYKEHLPPTVTAGGTVDYVSEVDQDFIADIEERERPAARRAGAESRARDAREDWITTAHRGARRRVARTRHAAWQRLPDQILGNPDPARRIAIVSLNVKDPHGRYLHPKFVTALLNDLFGIQSRAGCSCAGPYGHRLLQIDVARSDRYREWVKKGFGGIKPGWCRIGFHYAMDDAEADYLIDAVEFVAEHGHRFIPLYHFELDTGTWTHAKSRAQYEHLSLEAALSAGRVEPTARSAAERARLYGQFLDDARLRAKALAPSAVGNDSRLDGELGELQVFALSRDCMR